MSAARSRAADLAARAAAVARAGNQSSASAPTSQTEMPAAESSRKSAAAQVRTSALPGNVPAGPAPRTRPVRVTVELAPVEHRTLRRLCHSYAERIGAPQVAGAEVFRALLELVGEDEHLAERLGEALARSGGSRRRWAT